MIESHYTGVSTPVENSNKKKIVIIGLVIVLIVFGTGIFFWWKSKKTNTPNISVPTHNSSTKSAPIVDPFPDDADRDGISDTKEKELGISNHNFDTDGDGISDADEIDVWHTDPKKVDSDGDTFSDGYEVMKGYNPSGEGKLSQ